MKQTNCFLFAILLFCSLHVWAGGKKPTSEKQPSWVTSTTIHYGANRFDEDAQDGYTDLHFEKQISLREQAVFQKRAVHILSEAGVQNQSQISVDYDPSFQSLAFHSIKIIRDGAAINKLNLSKIETIQQEKELNRFIYNGSLTAVLLLDDVRKGDIVEYSYTLKGFNPIFGNRFAAMFDTQFGVPVYGVYYRVLVPKERTLYIRNSLTDLQPVITSTAAEKIYEWKVADTKAIEVEDNVPSWHDVYPMVMLSEYSSWKEIAEWAQELFPFPAHLTADLQKKVDEIKAAYPAPEAQLLATLRFVQDEVRYMGVEMGVSSHKPHSPLQVLKQRFGDCKDKAYLLCTLLKGLGIEAYPVLVNTYYKQTIANWQPTPTAFDHTTVCVQLKGKTWWFDPTIAYQRGPLEAISYPDYQLGLVIRPGSANLTSIALQDKGKVNVKEIFTVNKLGGPAQLKVITQFSGSHADNVRYDFKTNGQAEIRKKYKEFYSAYFKKIQIDTLTYSDDAETGIFTITERYTIRDFWSQEKLNTKVLLEPFVINSIMTKPAEEERTMPFALSYPTRYHEEVEVHLPEEWPIEEGESSFNDAAFSFRYRYSRPASDIVLLQYDYETLADHIKPTGLSQFQSEMAKAENELAFQLSSRPDTGFSTAFLSADNNWFTTAYLLLGCSVLVTYVYKRRRSRG